MIWTALPEAAALLASCAADPPATRYAKGTFGPNDGTLIYKGDRVKRLNVIHARERDRLWRECDKANPLNKAANAFSAHCRLTVQVAIQSVIDGRMETLELEAAE